MEYLPACILDVGTPCRHDGHPGLQDLTERDKYSRTICLLRLSFVAATLQMSQRGGYPLHPDFGAANGK